MEPHLPKSILKWVIWILVLGLIAYGLSYYFYIKSNDVSKDQIAEWKTYSNHYANYELQYPSNWIVQENGGAVSLLEHENYPDPSPGIFVSTYSGVGCDESLYNFVKDGGVVNAPDFPYTSVKLISMEKVANSNVEGYETVWIYSNPSGDKTETIHQVNFRNNKDCLIAEVWLSNNYNVYAQDKILSTFKFTNNDETTEWKTYKNTNTEYGLEIKYPSDWPSPTWDESKKEISFNRRIFIHYYPSEKDLPDTFYSKNSQDIILPTYGYSATKFIKKYCTGLKTNEIFTQTNFESFDPSKEPIYSIEGPVFECGYEDNNEKFSEEYAELEKTYDQMVSTFNFFIK